MTFFVAGFETTRNAIEFAVYNLALAPEIQERVFLELKGATDEIGLEMNYDLINGLHYLDQVVKGKHL